MAGRRVLERVVRRLSCAAVCEDRLPHATVAVEGAGPQCAQRLAHLRDATRRELGPRRRERGQDDDGAPIDRYDLVIDSSGTITVNGKPFGPPPPQE